jgi:hypothetical protein
MCGEMLGLVWRFGGWLGGFVVEDSGIGLVEGWRSGFGVGDGFVGWGLGLRVGGESDAAAGIHGVRGMNEASEMSSRRQRR